MRLCAISKSINREFVLYKGKYTGINILAFLAVFICSLTMASAQNLEFVAERKVADIRFDSARQVRLKLSKGRSLGSYLAVPLQKEIDLVLSEHGISPDTVAVVVQVVGSTGSGFYTYADFDADISVLPPYLLTQEKVAPKLYDTVYYQDKGDNGSPDMDMTDLNRQVFGTTTINVQLQFGQMDSATKNRVFTGHAVIFPVDKSPSRWLGGVQRLKIFIVE